MRKESRYVLIGIILVFLAVGAFVYTRRLSHIPSDTPVPQTPIPSKNITVSGKITCLPHKDTSGPQTLECAFGLQDEDGRYYTLVDSRPGDQPLISSTGETVTVKGKFTPEKNDRYQSEGTLEVSEIIRAIPAGWKTFSDPGTGITFQYPPDFSTRYTTPVDWPPKVNNLNEPFTCTEAGMENERAGRTIKRIIENRTYCITMESEGAAGSVYTNYAYATQINNKVVILTFSAKAVSCANYDDPQKTECENERTTADMDQLIDQIFGTLQIKS